MPLWKRKHQYAINSFFSLETQIGYSFVTRLKVTSTCKFLIQNHSVDVSESTNLF